VRPGSAWFRQVTPLAFPSSCSDSPRLATLAGTPAAGHSHRSHQAPWPIFPLQRQQTHDGLAWPASPMLWLHLWLETDNYHPGLCRPALPHATGCSNGNCSAPFSSRLALAEVSRPNGRLMLRQPCAERPREERMRNQWATGAAGMSTRPAGWRKRSGRRAAAPGKRTCYPIPIRWAASRKGPCADPTPAGGH